MELPTQIPMVNSVLPFIAIHTDVTCSAAFAYNMLINAMIYAEVKRGTDHYRK